MKHDRTEHRFLPDAAPSDWRGTNVYPHAPGGSSTTSDPFSAAEGRQLILKAALSRTAAAAAGGSLLQW